MAQRQAPMGADRKVGVFSAAVLVPTSVLFLVAAMVHQITVLTWSYVLAEPRGMHHDIDLVTGWVAGGPSLIWGIVAIWSARNVPQGSRRALVGASLLYLLLVASVLPVVCWIGYGASLSESPRQLHTVIKLSVLGLLLGYGSVLALVLDPAGLLRLIVLGLAGIVPLLIMVAAVARRSGPGAGVRRGLPDSAVIPGEPKGTRVT